METHTSRVECSSPSLRPVAVELAWLGSWDLIHEFAESWMLACLNVMPAMHHEIAMGHVPRSRSEDLMTDAIRVADSSNP